MARFGKGPLDPEDIVQATFLKISDHPALSDILDFRSYIFALACNIAIDSQRQSIRRSALLNAMVTQAGIAPAQHASSETILIDRERLRWIETAVRRMPDLRRKIFILIRIEGLSVPEVADQLGLSEPAIYKHVSRALHDCTVMLERSERRICRR